MSLPINVIVVVAIAILVLVVVAAFFATSTGGGMIEISRRNALSSACQTLRGTYNCASGQIGEITVKYAEIGEPQPTSHTLRQICDKLGIDVTTPTKCYEQCGCPSAGSSATPAPGTGGEIDLPG